jgi:hypothetical protein
VSWRPWLVVLTLMVGFFVNIALITQERVPDPQAGPEVTVSDEPLRHLQYLKTSRRGNFKAMGMTDELADATANFIDKYGKQESRYKTLLEDHATEIGDAFCPTDRLPQPYAALRFLVFEENKRRDVVSADRLVRFEAQPWFESAPVVAVYNTLEVTHSRKPDATLMAVGGILLGREDDVLEGSAPFATGLMGSWGFKRLKKDNPKVEMLVIQYFSMMHFLTELANTKGGICA